MLALALPGPALAQRGTGARLGTVQRRQQTEIRQGVQSGRLDRQQAVQLEKHEKAIRTTEAQDKAKGPMTGAEATQLRQETQRENAAIKHDEDSNGHNAVPPNH
jgi:hypothetical protein